MSRYVDANSIPPSGRAIALLIASTVDVQDAQPGVIHQLLEFSQRYTVQVLSDALVYAEHAGRAGKIESEDVVLAIQARVGWEFGGRVPKEYMLQLAAQVNAIPLPPLSEVYGLRLPPPEHSLTAVDFNLIPNKPPPGVKAYDEEVEEIEEEEESEEEEFDAKPSSIPESQMNSQRTDAPTLGRDDAPISAMPSRSPSDAEMGSPSEGGAEDASEGGEAEEEEGLFAGGDDSDADEGMEAVDVQGGSVNGAKRKLVEEDDYD